MKPNILYDSLKDNNDYFLSYELSNKIEKSTKNWNPHHSYDFTNSEISYRTIYDDKNLTYVMNNYTHRCEDFNKLDTSKHNILFAGCSATFGDGLPYKNTWDYILYDQLSKTNNLGPFNSLSYPGGSVSKIITNILKYCNSFGMPNEIYLMLPDYSRNVIFDKNDNSFSSTISIDYFQNKILNNMIPENLFFEFQNYYRMLEIFCKTNNIKLVSCSWDISTTMLMSKLDFDTFYFLDYTDDDFFGNFDIDLIDKRYHRYASEARDGHHFGIMSHHWFANNFLKWRGND